MRYRLRTLMFRFAIRELVLPTLVVAMGVAVVGQKFCSRRLWSVPVTLRSVGTSCVAIVATTFLATMFLATLFLALRISAGDEPGAPQSERDKRVQLLIDATVERYRLRPGSSAQTTLE